MNNHHTIALAGAGAMAALVAVDTVVLVTTGERTVVTDDSHSTRAAATAMSLALGATFATLVAVLVREARTFVCAGRLLRGARTVALVSMAALTVGFLVLSPLVLMTGLDSGPLYDASGLVALLALTGTTGAALVMGLGSLRRNRLGLGGRILSLLPVAALATVALALVEPAWASPIYCTVVVLLGYASIGLGAGRDRTPTEPRLPEPAPR